MNGAALLLLAALAAGRGEVIAKVNGVAITSEAFARRAAAMPSQSRARPADVVEALVAETLLAAEGRRAGLARSPAVERYVELETRRAAARALGEALAEGAKPDEETLRAAYHGTADVVRFESLVFETRAAADAAIARVKAGGTFAAEAGGAVVARAFPKAEDAPRNVRAELPGPLAAQLFAAAPGQVVGPLDLGMGFTIARLISKEVGDDAGFKARRDALVRHSKQQLAQQARKHFVEQRRSRAEIRIDDAFLASLGAGEPTAAQLSHPVATVNGRRIEYRDLRAQMQALAAGFGHASGDALRRRVLQQEIEATLVADLAVERGHLSDPAVVAAREDIERAALAAAYADQLRAATPSPGEDEIADHYRRNAARFQRPFAEVLPAVAASAAAEKREAAVARRAKELRGKASVSIDRPALARAAAQR